ncbi:COX15/CtaA family protein [Meridianimaribacter flavus]|uniref:Cytochrome c oxidase assembly protein subunit 15 n=1 Tax=Meridianimaribacter flavus TaxID=571115 RepID=A0ABY2G456_9FLAO|nr:COX15/CtaA family protein [Meridianimaribacter flavus]TDY11569.1 cytochrome c oxidase assembly protein subunit 15 [Meridianimaribacter flavus]
MKTHFNTIAKVTLVLTYLVIIAGAVVRMTGSGMGCPDWPKCFGYYIPPTEKVQLEWHANHDYKKGQVIIVDETLQVAKSNFTSSNEFIKTNWDTYTKHDYAVFNPTHTWVEYINRLFGALAGLATLVMAFASLKYWKRNKSITLLSFFTVFAMGFQAWLGKTVVDSNLAPLKITIHMVMALAIVAVMLYIIFKTKQSNTSFTFNIQFKNALIVALTLTCIQVVLGTQVREFVDHQIKALGEGNASNWLNDPTTSFYIHRSFSILVLLVNGYLLLLLKKHQLHYKKVYWVFGILLVEIASGIAMANFSFPFGSQTLHLILASILFGIQFYLILEATNAKNKV